MKRKNLILLALTAVGAALVLNACAPAVQAPGPDGYTLRPALSGERKSLDLPGFGKVVYYADSRGTGRPLVLTHAINAAGNAYEIKPLWDAYAGKRPVYALEWPGFGSSDRPDVKYTPELMTQALEALVKQLGSDVDVVALSLGSEFVARAALNDSHIRSLALISPSGFGKPRGDSQRSNQEDGGERRYNQLRSVGDPLYGLLRTRPSIKFFLDKSFRGPVPDDLIDYDMQTTRQPGAKYAPLYFVSGKLFAQDAYGDIYSKLNTPTLVLYDQDAFVSFDRLPLFAEKPGMSVVRIPDTDGLPHFEKLTETKAALETFWAKIP